MKTYTIRLQKYDDLLTIQDKITWGNTARILLVFTDHKKIVESRIDFARILRFSRQKGHQVALVIRDGELGVEAQKAGLVVFKSIDEAQKAGWKKNLRPNIDPGHHLTPREIKRFFINKREADNAAGGSRDVLIASCMIFFTLLILLLFFIPGAQITVIPKHQQINRDLAVTASSRFQPFLSSALIPAIRKTMILSGNGEASTTGETFVPTDYARGEVLLINLSTENIEIPAGTVVLALSDVQKRYQLLDPVKLVAGDKAGVIAKIKSMAPGEAFNADPGIINAIGAEFGQNVVVSNDQPVVGGSDLRVKTATQKDYDHLKEKIIRELNPKAANAFQEKLQAGEALVGPAVGFLKIVSQDKNLEVGQPGDMISLTLNIEFEGWIIKKQDIDLYAANALKVELPKDYEPVPGTLIVNTASLPVFSSDNITWTIKVQQDTRQILQDDSVRQNLIGKGIPDAINELQQQYDLISRPTVSIFPGWWPIMPFYYARITSKVE